MLRRCPMLLFATVALVCLFSIVSTGQSQPSLGEVAKQKSSTKKARRIITDDDMPQRTPEPAASSAGASSGGSASASSGSSGATASSAEPGSDKGKPAGDTGGVAGAQPQSETEKLKELDNKLQIAKRDKELLNKKLKSLAEDINAAESEFRRNMYRDALSNQQTTMAELDKVIREVEKEIAIERQKAKDKDAN